ncbi:MAG TPA: ABC transporter permease [Anaeromyxobacteraceae bacterium]|nr:ABC transporter permease [Anaeromyxobacteraceae bacterium]
MNPSRIPAILAIAAKDLRLLSRSRSTLFFALGWPVLMALFFGYVFGGGGEKGRIPVAVVDEDGTPESARLLARLSGTAGLEISPATREEATALVRKGKRSAAVIVPAGYGEAADRVFHGEPRRLVLEVDPARAAEGAMLEGILTGAAMQGMQELVTDPERGRAMIGRSLADLESAPPSEGRDSTQRLLGELRAWLDRPAPSGGEDAARPAWKPLEIERREVRREKAGPRSAFDFTFPQGILWGVIGSALGFSLSLVTERTRGTLLRLETAPLSRLDVLAGKALACFAAILAVEALLLSLGVAAFGIRPASWILLAAAAVALAACFVGIMMAVAVIARTEQAAGGLGWAILMPLAMIGGGMIPLFVMPSWMQAASHVSPVKWGILALEGATWRGFTAAEMAPALGVLLGVGLLGMAFGIRRFRGLEG